jgi:hypothetical protein
MIPVHRSGINIKKRSIKKMGTIKEIADELATFTKEEVATLIQELKITHKASAMTAAVSGCPQGQHLDANGKCVDDVG